MDKTQKLLQKGDAKGLSEASALDFVLPPELEASEPPEARGLKRDEVRLMVSHIATNEVVHTTFHQIADFLTPGDILVINTSGTLNAALTAVRRSDGTKLELHLSTHLPDNFWVVEMRTYEDIQAKVTRPFYDIQSGETFSLPAGAQITFQTPYAPKQAAYRLWIARLDLPGPLHPYLDEYGVPIRYSYVKDGWPSSYYQTVYATEPGSAEMPSAGRAFTPELITQLVANGIIVAPLLLHTGVASLEAHEPPYAEYYRVPSTTANLVNMVRASGKRVIAGGTTVIRALETVSDPDGTVHAGDGWTDLVITPQRGLRSVNALLTGLHEPQASHLLMLEALANHEHLQKAYSEALSKGYLWHEFGDLHLILP